ncbi:hypothetical protein [Clostridium algidicarnis]|uniref:Uncharacterized protein n=1 Tax=Clostridium algidicarnis DSM 15099 TaxID=1121295 RepID=A0A2S6FYZ6_9CLOT|nr:hypothetical protein [Clostridium algidicarnis]PPK48796.1 hypothetical protein BD821_10455 [Clostridium algidicarnis DSM 15099]
MKYRIKSYIGVFLSIVFFFIATYYLFWLIDWLLHFALDYFGVPRGYPMNEIENDQSMLILGIPVFLIYLFIYIVVFKGLSTWIITVFKLSNSIYRIIFLILISAVSIFYTFHHSWVFVLTILGY